MASLNSPESDPHERRFRFMLNAIPQQVWTATPDGALDYVNNVVCNDFGYTEREIVGHGWQKFIHPDDLPKCLDSWMYSLTHGTEYVVEFRLLFHDGTYKWHLARAVPYGEGGIIRQWLGTNTNIELQKSNELRKDEFLSIASHELKTPLTSIKAFNQLIKRTNDENRIAAFAEKSAEHISRLEKLINDLLDVTKINAGKMTYSFEPFNFADMLRDSIDSMRHITRQEISLVNAVDVICIGDRFRLEQVVNNFLSNAIKYSPESPKIIVSSSLEQGSVIVSIQDFGIGIARENLDRLFDRYYRVDNTAMRFEGLGLGLFISSEILKRHRGSFWIESEEGQGSTFSFRLPLPDDVVEQPGKKTDTFYQDKNITIHYNKGRKRMYVDWTGFQDLASVQKGCILMLEYLTKNNCDRIVNDNTHVQGDWAEAVEWVGNIWFPMMEKAGLKYFAHLFSPSTFSQLAAKKSIDIMAGIITTQYFTERYLAEEWIAGC